MKSILKYLNSLQNTNHIKNVFIKMKSNKDIDAIIVVECKEHIIPIRATIEARFYTDRSLDIKHIRALNNSQLLVLIGEDITLKIDIAEKKEFDDSKIKELIINNIDIK